MRFSFSSLLKLVVLICPSFNAIIESLLKSILLDKFIIYIFTEIIYYFAYYAEIPLSYSGG